jgi:hypothetical protein
MYKISVLYITIRTRSHASNDSWQWMLADHGDRTLDESFTVLWHMVQSEVAAPLLSTTPLKEGEVPFFVFGDKSYL